MSAETALLTTHILADPLARRPSFTPGGSLDYDEAVAVKTGTSQGHRDAWTVAYSDRLLVAAWVGNHDRRRMRRRVHVRERRRFRTKVVGKHGAVRGSGQ